MEQTGGKLEEWADHTAGTQCAFIPTDEQHVAGRVAAVSVRVRRLPAVRAFGQNILKRCRQKVGWGEKVSEPNTKHTRGELREHKAQGARGKSGVENL